MKLITLSFGIKIKTLHVQRYDKPRVDVHESVPRDTTMKVTNTMHYID